jgi:hypothetical protein
MYDSPRRSSYRKPRTDWIGLSCKHAVFALAMCLLAGLQGCTVLTSEFPETLEEEGRAPRGVHYFLPKTVIDIKLWVSPETATFRLTWDNRRSIADPRQRFYMRYRPLPQYEDKITVSLNTSGFLKSVIADTEDKTPQVILNLAQAFGYLLGGRYEAATIRPDEAQLVKLTVDPTDEADLATATVKLNKAARDYARAAVASVCRKDPDAGIILDPLKTAQCDEYKLRAGKPFIMVRSAPFAARGARHNSSGGEIVHRADNRHEAPQPHALPDADCSVGICYRSLEPVELWLVVGKSATRNILLVPNRARLVEIDIHRTFFVNKVQTIEFDPIEGALAKVIVNKPSELLAFSALPVAVLGAIADGLQLRITILNERINETTATRELIEARGELQRQRALLEASVQRAANGGVVSQSTVPRLSLPTAQSGSFLNRTPPTVEE